MKNKDVIEAWRKIIDEEDVPTLESEGLTEEDLHSPDDIVHPQQR